MRTLLLHYPRKAVTLLALSLILTAGLIAQPQYYNYNNVGTSSNTFPFGQAAGKAVNWLFLAGDFNQPTPLPPGNQITDVYFFITTGGSRTYTNLHILMAQSDITTLTAGSFYPGPWDTVYYNPSVTLSPTSTSWMGPITLDTPYPYDPTKSLVILVGQCGGPGTGIYVRQNSLTPYRRVWSVGGCPFVPTSGDGATVNFGVDVEPAIPPTPDMIYYKFEDNPSATTTPNCATTPVGNNPATFSNVTLTGGGQFDTCITGTGAASGGIVTGWNNNLGTSSWTISMWLTIPTTSSGSAYYLFGDPSGAFRCFHNGVALPNNLVLRGTGITDVLVSGIGPAPTVVTFVYDSAAGQIKAYKNGVLAVTSTQTLNLTAGSGFKVGGYSTSPTFVGKMDEFRLWRRALDSTEVSTLYNQDLACAVPVGISSNNNQIPTKYELKQNYPNPFNPSTLISFTMPKAGNVSLKVYDILGREAATLVNDFMTAGNHDIEFDASNLASGVYFYTIRVNDFTATRKMLLIK